MKIVEVEQEVDESVQGSVSEGHLKSLVCLLSQTSHSRHGKRFFRKKIIIYKQLRNRLSTSNHRPKINLGNDVEIRRVLSTKFK